MLMRKLLYILVVAAAAMVVTSCVNDDSDLEAVIEEYQIQPAFIQVDSTALAEDSDVVVTDPEDDAYGDYVENTNWKRTVYITLDGDSAHVTTVSGVTVTTTGAHVTVMNTVKKVKFVVTGSTTNGSIKFYSAYKFQLLLNGVSITNPNGAAINNQCSKSFYVVLADGTTNALADGSTYVMVDNEDQKGAFFSEGQMLFSGTGSLKVTATGGAGISTDDYIRVRPGVKLYVSSTVDNAMRAKDGIIIDGGVINAECWADGKRAIRSKDFMTVNGGRTVALSYGDPVIADGDTTAAAALRCDSLFTMTGGTLQLKATGDGGKALRAKGNVVYTGGKFEAVAMGTKLLKAAKGCKIDGDLTVSGGYFYSYSSKSSPMDVDGEMTVAAGYQRYEINRKVLTIEY